MLHCPVRIMFGDKALPRSGAYLQQLGTRALIVCGKTSGILSGALEELEQNLEKLGIIYHTYAQISENPGLEEIMAGKELCLAQACNILIGVGGGSPLDAAKAISLAAANDLAITELYDLSKFRKAYPIVAIPTTSGTGSEATQYSVLTNYATKTKAGFGHALAFPALAILDPRYTLSLPHKVTLNTALDALSHLLEGIYSNQREPLVFPLIYKGIGLIKENLPKALDNPADLQARSALMQASLYGGMVIAQSSTTLQHSIGYPLTTEYGVEHGLANAMVMESIMELYYPLVKDELEEMFKAIGSTRAGFLKWLEELPFTRHVALSDEFIERAIFQIMGSRNMALNPRKIDAEEIRSILTKLKG